MWHFLFLSVDSESHLLRVPVRARCWGGLSHSSEEGGQQTPPSRGLVKGAVTGTPAFVTHQRGSGMFVIHLRRILLALTHLSEHLRVQNSVSEGLTSAFYSEHFGNVSLGGVSWSSGSILLSTSFSVVASFSSIRGFSRNSLRSLTGRAMHRAL